MTSDPAKSCVRKILRTRKIFTHTKLRRFIKNLFPEKRNENRWTKQPRFKSRLNYTVRFLFTALFVIINNFLKRCHHLIHLFFFFLKKLLTKETKLVLYWIILRVIHTSRFGSAMQVLPSDIRKYFSSFLITAAAVVLISMFISVIENCIFSMDVNSYVGNKVDLLCNTTFG